MGRRPIGTKFKVGDIIVPNEGANYVYSICTEQNRFIGKVTRIFKDCFSATCISCGIRIEIGKNYDGLRYELFDQHGLLVEREDGKVLKINHGTLGVVGTETNLKDAKGNILHVGDVVRVFDNHAGYRATVYVVERPKYGLFQPFGCGQTWGVKGYDGDGWRCVRTRSWIECTEGDFIEERKCRCEVTADKQ